MKLVRYGRQGAERPGMLDAAGRLRDLGAVLSDIDGAALVPDALDALAALDPAALPEVPGRPRLGPCLGRVGKIVCVGLNYSDHAAEAGMAVPTEPILFLKATSAISGPADPVRIPPGSAKTDHEVELGVVIGRTARRVTEAGALDHVAGYCIVNDVSERAWQIERLGQWTKGKAADSFCPTGPWLVTADEVPDPQALRLWLDVDGERRQDGTTANMVFGVARLVSCISHFMTLEPGDLIATGTPAGVGMGMTPQRFLRAGQSMRLGIDGLGEQHLPVVQG